MAKEEEKEESVPKLDEKEEFRIDKEVSSEDKNAKLAEHLSGGIWTDKHIVKIKRIEIGTESGWLIFYRK